MKNFFITESGNAINLDHVVKIQRYQDTAKLGHPWRICLVTTLWTVSGRTLDEYSSRYPGFNMMSEIHDVHLPEEFSSEEEAKEYIKRMVS